MSLKTPSRIAIIGAGTIGASWATLFLAKGCDVVVYDPVPDAAPESVHHESVHEGCAHHHHIAVADPR